MKHCKYCANSDTRLDSHGYCIKYNCFERSGIAQEVRNFVNKIKMEYWDIPKNSYGQIGTVVINPYNRRHRHIDTAARSALNRFGFIPKGISSLRNFHKGAWDKNIRW